MERLPFVLVDLLFGYLDGLALARFSQSSRHCYRRCRAEGLWKALYKQTWGDLPRTNVFDSRLSTFYFFARRSCRHYIRRGSYYTTAVAPCKESPLSVHWLVADQGGLLVCTSNGDLYQWRKSSERPTSTLIDTDQDVPLCSFSCHNILQEHAKIRQRWRWRMKLKCKQANHMFVNTTVETETPIPKNTQALPADIQASLAHPVDGSEKESLPAQATGTAESDLVFFDDGEGSDSINDKIRFQDRHCRRGERWWLRTSSVNQRRRENKRVIQQSKRSQRRRRNQDAVVNKKEMLLKASAKNNAFQNKLKEFSKSQSPIDAREQTPKQQREHHGHVAKDESKGDNSASTITEPANRQEKEHAHAQTVGAKKTNVDISCKKEAPVIVDKDSGPQLGRLQVASTNTMRNRASRQR